MSIYATVRVKDDNKKKKQKKHLPELKLFYVHSWDILCTPFFFQFWKMPQNLFFKILYSMFSYFLLYILDVY